MNIILRNGKALVPFYRPLNTFDLWDTLSREMWDSWRPFTFDDRIVPNTLIYEEKGQLIMKTELPGIDKKDLDISLEGDKLTVKAEKKERIKEDSTHHNRGRYYGQYLHSVTLPYPVKEDEVTARFEKGVLELRLPKGDKVEAKKIEIKAQLLKGETKKPEQKLRQKNS